MIKKQLKALYPGFVFNELAKLVRLASTASIDEWDSTDIIFMQRSEYNKIPYVEIDYFGFFINFDQTHHQEMKNLIFYQIQFHNQNINTYQYQHF